MNFRDKFGPKWALLAAVTVGIACVGALITEFAGLAGLGALVGLPRWISIAVPALRSTPFWPTRASTR